MRRRWVSANPCKLVDAAGRAEPSSEIRFLTQAELVAVLDRGVPDDDLGAVERPLYLMAAMTGLRQGELLALRWLDLDAAGAQGPRPPGVRARRVQGAEVAPRLPRRPARGSLASRSSSALRFVVRVHRRRRPGLRAPGDRTSRSIARRSSSGSRRACRRAGVRVVRFHDLRHTFGTRVAASGEVSLRTLQEWMGHRDAKTTLIYADYQPGEREAELVSKAFSG